MILIQCQRETYLSNISPEEMVIEGGRIDFLDPQLSKLKYSFTIKKDEKF